MEIISALNLEQLGTAGVMLGYLIWANYGLKQDLSEEREHSKKQEERHHAFALKSVEALSEVKHMMAAIKESLR